MLKFFFKVGQGHMLKIYGTIRKAFVLMLTPFIPEFVLSMDLMSFEHPSVRYFNFA